MRSEGYSSWFVCLLPLQLPSRTAIRHENDITYQVDCEDQFNRTVFSENAALRRSSSAALVSYTCGAHYIQSEGISQSGLTVMFAEPQ